MRWNAQSHNSELQVEARLYLMEALHVPGSDRPAYSVGDHVRLGREGYWHVNANIMEVRAGALVIEDVDTHTRYKLKPSEEKVVPVPDLEVPYEDYTITA